MPGPYSALVIERPWLTIALLLALALGAAWGARDFRLDASSDSLVVETDPDLAKFRRMNERFGTSEFLVVTYEPEGDLLSEDALDTIARLRDALATVEGVSSVLSVLDVPLLRSPPAPLSELAENVRTLQSPGVDLALAREELTTSPLYSNLIVSPDAQATALQVNLEPDSLYVALLDRRNGLLVQREERALSEAEAQTLAETSAALDAHKPVAAARQARLIADVRAIVARFEEGAELHLAGVPMIADDMLRYVRNDLTTFGLGVLALIVATLAFFFRRPRWVLLPLTSSALVTLYMIGLLGAFDWPVTVISSNFVSLLIILSISLTIHLIVRYRELLHEKPSSTSRELVVATVQDKWWPCFYTSLTTMVAFGSLVTSGIVPVIDFGWMMTIGVAVALAVAFLLFPAVLMLLPPGTPAGTLGQQVDATEALGRMTARGLWPTVGVSLVLAGAATWGISRLSVENSFIDYFDEDTEIYQGMSYVDAHLGGTTPLDVLIDFPAIETGFENSEDPFADPFAEPFASDDDAAATEDPFADPFGAGTPAEGEIDRYWFTPDKIALIERAHAYLDAQPETGKVVSLATLHEIARQFNEGRALDAAELAFVIGAVPEQFQESLLRPYASPETNQARISVRMIESDRSLQRDAFLARVHRELPEILGVPTERVEETGMMVLMNNMLQSLFASQVTTVLWVGGGILFTFVILFRSLRLGVIALLPNALAAALVLGIMGIAGLPLDLMTITIAAIVIGIGVDDTIHYVHRFQQELATAPDYVSALHASHGSIGHAMYYTSLTVIAGFSILALSNFNPTIYFGTLTALSMGLALLANLTLLPALIVLSRPFGPPGGRADASGASGADTPGFAQAANPA
jgi:predicted RND superfamily exporter protein